MNHCRFAKKKSCCVELFIFVAGLLLPSYALLICDCSPGNEDKHGQKSQEEVSKELDVNRTIKESYLGSGAYVRAIPIRFCDVCNTPTGVFLLHIFVLPAFLPAFMSVLPPFPSPSCLGSPLWHPLS